MVVFFYPQASKYRVHLYTSERRALRMFDEEMV